MKVIWQQCRAAARIAPGLHDNLRALVDGALHGASAGDGRNCVADRFANARHPR